MTATPPAIDDEALLNALSGLRQRATRYDLNEEWPAEDLSALSAVGAMRWVLPIDVGGLDVPAVELHLLYERVASASLATALILSQRDAAVGLIDASKNSPLRRRLLERLATNDCWTSVGISQLTTSRNASLVAVPVEGGFMIDGLIPWCTGGEVCEFVVAGAACGDEKQLLFVLPTGARGVTIHPPPPLIALAATRTVEIECASVFVPTADVLAGPVAGVLGHRSKAVPIGQAFAAFGLSHAALALIDEIDSDAARATHANLLDRLTELHRPVVAEYAKTDGHDLQTGPLLRSECNDLAIRTTHAAVALHKGGGLRRDHPVQRLAREALFLLVWSSPTPVVERTLETFVSWT